LLVIVKMKGMEPDDRREALAREAQVLERQDGWYIRTSEGETLGPYATRAMAEAAGALDDALRRGQDDDALGDDSPTLVL
jgi:hypothetical protein